MLDRNEILLCGVLILALVAGLGVRHWQAHPEIEPVLIDSPTQHNRTGSTNSSNEPLPLDPGSSNSEKPDINRATAIDLQQVPGIGQSISSSIIAYRDRHGPFRSMDELQQVQGIGESRLARLKEWFSLPGEAPAPGKVTVSEGQQRNVIINTPGTSPQGNLIDINTASASQLEALPGIGPVLAAAIVDYRNRSGAFRNPEELDQVPGIGPKRLAQIKPHITIEETATNSLQNLNSPLVPQTISPSSTVASPSDKLPQRSNTKLDLNQASQTELETLPGIGPVLAKRILEYRQWRGGFQSKEELKSVSGIGEKKYAQLQPLVEIR